MFNGFQLGAFQFYDELGQNNNRRWWLDHQENYLKFIKEPMEALTLELAADFGLAHIFRPNRDIRFSKDKSLYKTQASFYIPDQQLGDYYFELSARGMYLGGGLYGPERDQLQAWYKLFDTKNKVAIKDFLSHNPGLYLMRQNDLKTAPKGYKTDHPEIDFLRLKHFVVGQRFQPDQAWIYSDESLVRIKKQFQIIREWNKLLYKYIGDSKLPKKW